MSSRLFSAIEEFPLLLRGDAAAIRQWLPQPEARRLALHLFVIVLGTALFGAAIGLWRSPLQAMFTALKFPLIVLLTTGGNALLNGMIAPLFGVNISFRQSFMASVLSWSIAGSILGAVSPLMFFLLWNTPAVSAGGSYSLLLLTLVFSLALAGIAANVRLLRLLQELGGRAAGTRTLFAWLAGNLLLGSQLCWIARPFVGYPGLPVQFLRPNAFESSFFESLFNTIKHLFT